MLPLCLLGLLSPEERLVAGSWGITALPYGALYGPSPAAAAASCRTPSALVPRSKKDAALCITEYTVAELTDGEWRDLKWGSIEVMCRASTQSMIFFLENCPRFSWSPFRAIASAARRVAGSVDIRTATVPLPPFCECDPRSGRPFFTEIFQKEQYIVGAKMQSTPIRVFEFFGEQTTCDIPMTLSMGGAGTAAPLSAAAAATAAAATAAVGGPQPFLAAPSSDMFEFREVYRCSWRIVVPLKPQVFASRNEVRVSLSPAAATAATAANIEPSVLSLRLPPACQMQDIPHEFKVWVRDTSAAATAAAGFVRLEQQQQQGPYEVYLQVDTSSTRALNPDSAHYRRVPTVADFDLAVERGQ